MGGRRDLRHTRQQLDIRCGVVEVIITEKTAVGLSARRAVLVLVDLLKDWTLVPSHALIFFQRLSQFLLGYIHHADL